MKLWKKPLCQKPKQSSQFDLGGIVCNYAKVFENVEKKRNLFISVETDGSPLGALSSRMLESNQSHSGCCRLYAFVRCIPHSFFTQKLGI